MCIELSRLSRQTIIKHKREYLSYVKLKTELFKKKLNSNIKLEPLPVHETGIFQ